MKRFGKFLGFAALAVAAAVFMGCPTPNGGGNTGGGTNAVYSGDEITFEVSAADSVDETNTMLIIKYDRQNKDQLKGMTLSNVDLAVTVNSTKVTMPSSLKFELDPYSFFDNDEEKNADDTYKHPKEYKVKLPIGRKLVKGDMVKVKLNSASVTNPETDFSAEDDIPTIVISLIDTAEAAGWYKELCPNAKEYQTLITKKDGEKFPADDENVEPDPDDPRPAVGTVVYKATGEDLTIKIPVNFYGDANHGIQFAVSGSKYLPKGAKAGESYTIVMKGTADEDFKAQIQFLTAEWEGFGEAIDGDFKNEGFAVSGKYTFGSDTADGFQFVISNSEETLDSEKTLSLTDFTITRTE